MKAILSFFLMLITAYALAQTGEVPFTLADRDRLIKLDSEVSSLRNEMMTRFDSQQRQIDDMKTLFYWGFSILITFMIFLFGFIIWDRRTAMEPLRLATQAVSEQSKSLLTVLRELAKDQPRMQELLRTHGLL